MTEETAKSVLERIAERANGRWRVVDRAVHPFGTVNPGRSANRKRFNMGYGDAEYAMVFCQGDTWREALDDYVKECRRCYCIDIPSRYKGANSAEELALKTAVAGEISDE